MMQLTLRLFRAFREGDIHQRRADYMDVYRAVCNCVERENTLINFRIQWSIVLSVGILATEGILFQGIKVDSIESIEEFIFYRNVFIVSLSFALSSIACAFSYTTMMGVRAALSQMNYIREEFYRHVNLHGNTVFEDNFGLPRPFGNVEDHASGHAVSRVFPAVMFIIWAIFSLLQLMAISSYVAVFVTESKLPVAPYVGSASQQLKSPAKPHPHPRGKTKLTR